MFGLNTHVLIVLVFPLNVLNNTGSENIVCGKIPLFIFILVFIFDILLKNIRYKY